jgi:hypothetical protein
MVHIPSENWNKGFCDLKAHLQGMKTGAVRQV